VNSEVNFNKANQYFYLSHLFLRPELEYAPTNIVIIEDDPTDD